MMIQNGSLIMLKSYTVYDIQEKLYGFIKLFRDKDWLLRKFICRILTEKNRLL